MIIPEVKSVRTKLFIFVMLTILLMCAVFAVTLYTMTLSNIKERAAAAFRTSFALLNENIKSLQVDLLKYTDILSQSVYLRDMEFGTEAGLREGAGRMAELANLGNIGALAVFDEVGNPIVFAFRKNGDYFSGYMLNGRLSVIKDGAAVESGDETRFIRTFLGKSKNLRPGYNFSDLSGVLAAQYTGKTVKDGKNFSITASDFLDSTFVRKISSSTGMDFTYYINGKTAFSGNFKPEAPLTTPFPSGAETAEKIVKYEGMNVYFQKWVIDGDTSVDFGFAAQDYALRDIRRNILVGFIMIWCFVVVLVVPVSLFLLNLAVTKPLRELQAAVRKAESLDYDQFLPIKRSDEIGDLVSAYNELIKRIKEREAELQDMNGRLKGMVELETGLRQKNEQLLFEQQKFVDMGRMVNAIAHQWRQPLNIIGLAVQSFVINYREKRIDMAEADDFEEKVMAMLQHMSATIDDFRNFFRSDKTEKQFSVITGMVEVIRLINAQLKYNGVTLNYTCRSGSEIFVFEEGMQENPGKMAETAIVSGFPGEFKQAVMNIAQNSRDAVSKKLSGGAVREGIIDIVLEVGESDVTFTISDNGGGIDPDVIDRIFDPYFTTKQNESGTGIGLYMTKTIIEGHMKGRISASNTNNGAVFTVVLPKFTS